MAGMIPHLTLDGLEERLERIDTAWAEAQWRKHFDPADTRNGLGRLEAARSALLLDSRAREALDQWRRQPADSSRARRIVLLTRRFRWAQIEAQPEIYELRNRIDQAILSFRPRINGRPVDQAERLEILRRHPDSALRHEAWLAMAPLAARIEADVRELLRRRQAMARDLGYDGFVSWALDVVGLSQDLGHGWIEELFDQLLRLTDAPFRAWLDDVAQSGGTGVGLCPWDLAFVAAGGGSLPEDAFGRAGLLGAVKAVADGLGLGEQVTGVRVDAVDVPYGALCYAVHPPDDVRILFRPADGHSRYGALFHEFGHALHWRCLRTSSPALRWESSPFNEAMACIWERLVWEPDWLSRYAAISPDQAQAQRERWRWHMIYRLRRLIAQATFEYRAYRQWDGDLLALSRDTFAEILSVPFDRLPGWAASPFWTSHPIYLQNYVIAEVVASQTLAALRRQFGRLIGEPRVGAWLAENYYAPGAALPWAEKVRRATGAPLSSADFCVDLLHNGRAVAGKGQATAC